MHPVEKFLRAKGRGMLRRQLVRIFFQGTVAIGAYLVLYAIAVLSIKSLSLTLVGLLGFPLLVLLAMLVWMPMAWWQLRGPRQVARHLEKRLPEFQLTFQSCMDFLEGRADDGDTRFGQAYLEQTTQKVANLKVPVRSRKPWGTMALGLISANLLVWFLFGSALSKKYYNPDIQFGKTHLNLEEGSITIFEPEYTQIPGRTLPLKSGTFQAFPGSLVRFMLKIPNQAKDLYMTNTLSEEPVPLRLNEEGFASHEFVLLESQDIAFLIGASKNGTRTQPYEFRVKTDNPPEIQLRSHTPEGLISTLDPLMIEAELKDDFGVQVLEAVITWEGNEKRLPLTVPGDRKKHFNNRNQWYLSDLDIGEAESFSIYLEAKDNNPINGPGIGQSEVLRYELESPEKKYDEFMEMARQLLDTMTNTLGDNLETAHGQNVDIERLRAADSKGKEIRRGLFQSLELTNSLIGKVRNTPNVTHLDQNFLLQFRDGVSRQARARTEMGFLYASIFASSNVKRKYSRLLSDHSNEELKLEKLTYDLLLQLKMWAILELERDRNEMENTLEQMQELLDNSENMTSEELMEMFEKLMAEVMKDFQEMMQKAAEQMDMSMQEFMNQDAMQFNDQDLQSLMEEIMEALKQGDMEKAKKLMEQMRAQMENASQSMQNAMGEMSPETQAMMKQMREFMGLLRELKEQEEQLARETQELKSNMDQDMGGNGAEMDEAQKNKLDELMERIKERLTLLNNKLTDYKTEDLTQKVLEQIQEKRDAAEGENQDPALKLTREAEINQLERLLDFLNQNGLQHLKNRALESLNQANTMDEYLEQAEYDLGLETGLDLEKKLSRGERMSDRTLSDDIKEDARPKESFLESRMDLYEILDALQNMRQQMENRRRSHMNSKGEQAQQKLAERQAKIQEMIKEFQEKAGELMSGSPLMQKLEDIGMSMRNAERKLGDSRLDGGLQFEQQAIQQIGELMEQMQQAQQPNPGGSPMQMMMRPGQGSPGMQGDPTGEVFVPDSQKVVSKDAVKEAIRKQLQKNLPESYSKEIRKYYEKLMDQ